MAPLTARRGSLFHSSCFLPTVIHITPCRKGKAILYAEVGGKDPQKQELKPPTHSSPSKTEESGSFAEDAKYDTLGLWGGGIIHSLPSFHHPILTFHWTPTQSLWEEEQRKGKNERGSDYALKHCCTAKNSHQRPAMRSLSANIRSNILQQSHWRTSHSDRLMGIRKLWPQELLTLIWGIWAGPRASHWGIDGILDLHLKQETKIYGFPSQESSKINYFQKWHIGSDTWQLAAKHHIVDIQNKSKNLFKT